MVDIETYTVICLIFINKYIYICICISIYPDHPITRFNIVVSLTPCLYLTPSFHCLSLLYLYIYTYILYTYIHIYHIPITLYPYHNSNEFHSSGESVRLMTSAPRVLKRFDRLWWQLQRGQTPGPETVSTDWAGKNGERWRGSPPMLGLNPIP